MASIKALPIELLHEIVDLTVEDAIALRGGRDDRKQEQLRRNILIRLALVSKDFTRPAQLALWRYMKMNDIDKVADLIEAGFGKDKVIEELEIWIDFKAGDGHERFKRLVSFLRGVKKVINITALPICGSKLMLEDFFEIDSIKELKSIGFFNYDSTEILVLPQTRLPSHLRHLTIYELSKGVDDIVSRSIESSVSSLISIKLDFILLSEYFGSKLCSVLALLGPQLRKLEVADCDNSILLSLLPHCSSLKSLGIHSNNIFYEQDFKSMIGVLGTISKSVILESFTLSIPPTSNLVHLGPFLQLLKTSPFDQLNNLYMCSYVGSGRARQELENFVRGNVEFMELIETRGISLEFATEEEIRLEAEKEKQRMYQERQEKLDLDSKGEEEVAESKK